MTSTFNLPPGCSTQDIERAAGAVATCYWCGRLVATDSIDQDEVCPRCRARADQAAQSDH